ncbi:ATP-binding protein, partial [Sulfurimonas sp. SAG-AH-194-C21]
MSKDGLKKVYLIKSAGFEFSEIDLTSNTLLLGESGVGKTTIMRATLFFYTMDYSDSILNLTADTKKSFNDWYFKEHNSHVVYEYTKGESRFLFVVSKSGKLHYTFIDISACEFGVKELFIDEKMPVNLEKLNEKIQKENLPNYTTTIKEKYINTFHKRDTNNKKIKQESVVDFTLFENSNYTKEFAKTLSNIFISSKVNSNSIKKSIVSLIENADAKIDLNEIRINLDEYVSHKDEIEKFEKKIPNIEKLSQRFDEYNAKRKEFKIKANKLHRLKQEVSVKTEEVEMSLNSLQEEEKNKRESFSVALGIINAKTETINKEMIEQEKELKDLQKRENEYRKINIDILVDESNKEENYKNELQSNEERYKALTSEFETIKEKYQKLIQEYKKDADAEILNLKEKNLEISTQIHSDKSELIESKEKNILAKTQRYRDEKDSFVLALEEEKKKFNTINIELGRMEFFPFNAQEIAKYEETILKYNEALAEVKISQSDNGIGIKQVESEIAEIAKKLKLANEKLDTDVSRQKEKLFQQKEDFEKKLDFDKDNLYGYLQKNSISNREKIVTYLKDEILFSEKPFSVTKNEDKNSIFGLNVAFDEAFENDYEQTKLQNGLKAVKESIKSLNKESIRKKKVFEDEASQETRVKNRQRAVLYQQKTDLEENKKSYVKNINIAKSNLSHAQQVAGEQREEKTAEIQKQFLNAKHKKEEFSAKIEQTDKEIEAIVKLINEDVKKAVDAYSERLKSLNLSQISKVQNIQTLCNEKIESTNAELTEVLQKQGVDEVLLQNISKEIKLLKTKLLEIDKNRTTVIVYISEYKDKILLVPSLVEKLQSDSKYFNDLEKSKAQLKET